MADQEREQRPAAGGSGFSRRIAGAPLWVWAAGAGAVAGVVWFFYRRNKSVDSSQAAASNATSDQGLQTTIVPSDNGRGGLAEAQFDQLLAAIRALQGESSTPPATTPPDKTTLPQPTGPVVTPPPRQYHPIDYAHAAGTMEPPALHYGY